jgi:cell wall-associated NlpC family hydrolase
MLSANPACAGETKKYLVVTAPAANIRSKPIDASDAYIKDDLQETQVLYNEILLYKDENADWYYVEAIEQREFTHNNAWQGYPGWIRKKSVKSLRSILNYNIIVKEKTADILSRPDKKAELLFTASMGTKFSAQGKQSSFYKVALANGNFGWLDISSTNKISEKFRGDKARKNIIATAKSLLGTPYLWGARSILINSSKTILTGVDCSGLTGLVYRANNILIPRDAHEQWLAAREITVKNLLPGDLIFLSKKNKFEAISHVMLYLDKDTFIESPGTGDSVKFTTFKRKFDKTLFEIEKDNFIANNSKIYFGRIKDLDG